MILLDTDHVTVLKMPASERRTRLVNRLALAHPEIVGIPIIAVEEVMRGWLTSIAKERASQRQVRAYRELTSLFEFFAVFQITTFDEEAARMFDELRTARIRIGTKDLKIAAICRATNALLLTANRRDFEKVPGLRFENWLE